MSNKVIIKNSSTTLILILSALLVTAVFYGLLQRKKYKTEQELIEQISGNYTALTDTLRAYQVKVDKLTTLNAAIAYKAYVEVSEWQAKNKHDAELIRKMGVKLNRLQSVTTSTLVTTDTIKVDSIVYLEGKSTYRFISDYMKADVRIDYIEPDKSELNYEYRNDLILTNEFRQRKFLFFRIGKKYQTSHIVSKDKNCKITKFEVREMIK